MINPRMNIKPAIGIAVAAIFAVAACYVAMATDLSNATKPTAVDAERYADFVENEVFDVQDLAEGAEIQRRFFNRITPPGFSWVQPMFPSLVPFDSKNFDDSLLDDLLGEDKNSVAIYPLSLALDSKTRETLVYNADGKLIATIPSNKASRAWPEDADPARVILQLDLLPAEDVEPYLYTESRISEFSKSKTTKRGTAQRSLGSSEFGICNIQKLTNGNMRLTLTNGTDTAEVFAYTVLHTSSVVVVTWTNEDTFEVFTDTNTLWTPVSPSFNGLASAWEYAATNLTLTNGVGVWVDANVSSNARTRFYGVANRMDSDEDGLTDGSELFHHHTDPSLGDTDGDGLMDGEEVNDHGTSPRRIDSDSDGLNDGEEIHAYGTNPLSSDTDGDGMTDGWEIVNGFNPLLGIDGTADVDGDGLSNAAEQQAGTDPHLSDSDGDGIPDGTDSSPAMGNCSLQRELAWRLPLLNRYFTMGNMGSPVFGATVVCQPTGFVGNVIAITNITLRGVVDDAYMINGFCYEWSLGAKSFTREITEAVTDRLTGRFSVDVYDYILDCPYNMIGLMSSSSTQGAECTYQYLVALMVELSHSEDWECWSTNGTYDASSYLATDSCSGSRVNWSLARIAGSSASISSSGVVTFGAGGGQYRIRVSASELSTCGDSMTLFVPKVDIQQTLTNVCWDCGCNVVLELSPTSFSPGGYIWSSTPDGISGRGASVTFNPSNLLPGTYTVRAQSASMPSCEDFCIVNVLKVEIEAQAGKINYGFDPNETVKTGGPYAWTSVDEEGTSGLSKIDIEPSAAANEIELVVVSGTGSADISPKTFIAGSTDLTITGQGTTGNALIEARIGYNGPACEKLNIMALPKQTLTAGIYYIKDSSSSGTFPVDGPTADSVIDTLNDVFEQARIEFSLEDTATVDKPFDSNGDGKFQASEVNELNVSSAEWKGDLKIFFIKNSGIPYGNTPPLNSYYIRGIGLFTAPGGIIFTSDAGGISALGVAHEFGHQLISPDHDTPPWPSGEESLMRDGYPQSDGAGGFTLPNPGRWLRHEDWHAANEEAGNL